MEQLNLWVTTYLPLTSTVVVAAATVVLVWLTSRYVRLTGRLVEESQKSREPLVTVDFEIHDNSLRLVIVNHGLSPARNVRIHVLKDVGCLRRMSGNRTGLADCGPIKEGVSYLTPSRKLKYYLGHLNCKDIPEDQLETSLHIIYENEAGKQYEHTVDFDFGQMREVLLESFKDPGLAVAEAIKEVESDRQRHERVSNIFSSYGGPKMKKCSMCAEMIPEEARKCAHCQTMQEQAVPKEPAPKEPSS